MEIARHRDFHATRTPDGSVTEVTNLHSSISIPIYTPVSDLGERVRLVVERLPIPIWVTGPEGGTNTDHKDYALFAGAITFWIWQFSALLTPVLSSIQGQPVELNIKLPAQMTWQGPTKGDGLRGRPPVETKTDRSKNRIEVTINEELFPVLQKRDNTVERELMRFILPSFSSLLEDPSPPALSPEAIDKTLNIVAPIGLEKMLLLFDSSTAPEVDDREMPSYRPLQKVWINAHLDQIGEYMATEGGLKVGEVNAPQRVRTLNTIAAYCFSQMQRIGSSLSPQDLLQYLVRHAEAVCREQALNKLTLHTRLQCFQSEDDVIDQLVNRTPELTNVGLASRFLIEYFVAQPPNGIRQINLDVYDELRAWAYHVINYAMFSDAIHSGLQDHGIALLPSKRIGIDGIALQSAINGHMRAFALDQISIPPGRSKSIVKSSATLKARLDAATSVEFGVPISELLELMEFAINVGQQQSPGVAMIPIESFLEQASVRVSRSIERIRVVLQLLTLQSRPTFWTPPDGYVKQDLYPWRYNRPLSYLRRPFLTHDLQGETKISWGPRHVRNAQRFLVDQCMSGRLRARSQGMRSFMNQQRDKEGEKFNKEVADFFQEVKGLSVRTRVKKVGSLRELQDHLGDIDVLVGDSTLSRILVIECKDLSVARTPYEMANQFNELFVGTDEKKSIVAKHQARVRWVKNNLRAILEILDLNAARRWKVSPLIVVDQPLFASYLRTSPIHVLSLEEIRRSWPKIGRSSPAQDS
jgi:hypothetical protein